LEFRRVLFRSVVYFIATSATPAVQDAAPSPASSTSQPQAEPTGLEEAPTPEPEVAPQPAPAPEPEPEVEPGRYSYEKSLRWGPEMVDPPELTRDEQVLADVACNFIAAQYDFAETGNLDDETEAALSAAVEEFREGFMLGDGARLVGRVASEDEVEVAPAARGRRRAARAAPVLDRRR